MKALTLWQPYAQLCVEINQETGQPYKTIETRSWSTSYRGPLAIHAAAKRARSLSCSLGQWRYGGLSQCLWRATPQVRDLQYVPVGVVVATCTLVDVVPVTALLVGARVEGGWSRPCSGNDCLGHMDPNQRPYGDFTEGRFAWLLADVTPLDPPVPAKGRQGLWEWTP